MSGFRDLLKGISGVPKTYEARIGTLLNYLRIRTDGTVRLKGEATSWKDMVMDLIGKKLTSNVGKVDYDFDEMAMKFQNGGSITNDNDIVGGNLEINHEFLVGLSTTFKPHIHWFQEVVSGTQAEHTFAMKWRLQNNGTGKTTAWETATCSTGLGLDDIWDFSGEADGFYNQISRFDDMVVDCNVSDTFQIKVTKTDSTGGDALVYFFDLHGKIDSFGSDDEIAKS